MANLTNQDIQERVQALLEKMTLHEKVSLLSGKDAWHTVSIERLGIPSMTMTDGPHGVRSSYPDAGRKAGPTTCFPTGVSMAATWNTELIEQVGAALAEETRGMGCDILLGPCVNIVRHPLAGRNFEAYSEDPFVAGKIGTAWVKGLQSRRVGASLKHFACNNQEVERFRGSSQVDERTLREIYLPHFEMVVKEAQPYTVMCSYNRINGVYASENRHLLREILKNEWGFEGLVVSDWGANHTTIESVKNGLDLEMPGPAKYYGQLLEEGVNIWQIDEADINDAVRRILTILFKVGRFEDEASLPAGSVNSPQHQELARVVAEESITLLKNEGNLLPLRPEGLRRIAVIGPNAAEDRIGGGGSSFVDPPYRVSPLQGLEARLGNKVEIVYEKGCDNWQDPPVIGQDYLQPLTDTGQGLKVEFFDNPNLQGEAVDVLYVPKTEFWMWANSLPAQHVTSPRFSLRASGRLQVPESGEYTLYLSNTAQCRVIIDGKQILEHLSLPSNLAQDRTDTRAEYSLHLESGKAYALVLEFLKDDDLHFAHARLALSRKYQEDENARIARAAQLASTCDVAIIFAGMPEGFESEGADRPHMRLPGPQDRLIEAVAQANPHTIVVLNAGSPVEMPWADQVPAIVEAYYPGQEGGNAIARILLGEVNPSGKLTVTFPRRLEDTPAYINYPGGREVIYGEGIFVGYRYYDKKDIQPLFPFGHGLSYTTFEYRDLTLPQEARIGESVEVSVTVKNTGSIAGKEVVQLYVCDPESSLARPPKELKGFAKVALAPGESKTVKFTLDSRAFAFYDPYQSRWVVERGQFEILVGSSSRDIRLKASLTMA
ncbi:MAG TPA: beta-D-glucoside glucohydrolase [Anaerolinea thermolimosa]|uniref:Beta-D-glucoside glucohydrolase n=1 Tax=Anaerolinea thermolimosa TaxID=229919 RepID=A0A3D1JDS5_9CHLR|nr:glycoside hydrolase family 3 C-terminal domain-containing protein [Anaerolinea thermolimosa]GAP06216.1 beta-glucosidase-related glycosidase [Anaerolinea thermolimosa]HCE16729.1 beta-D-glucoside glucohydrolase [Anaerolinea thermolimosa]